MRTLAPWLAMALPLLAQDKDRDEVAHKLNNIRVTLDLKDAPLDTVVAYLHELSALNIVADAKVREMNLAVTLKVGEISLKSVFNLMFKPYGCGILYRDGVVMILRQEDISDRTMKLELYDCRDILHPIRNFPGADFALTEGIGVAVIQEDQGAGGEITIAELVRAHTGGRTWDENPKAVCNLQNGILVVRQTPEVHRQVVRLLNLLRRNKSLSR